MRLRTVGGGAAVLDQSDVVIEHETDGERVEHAHAGADAGDEQAFDAAGAQKHVKVGADERAVAVFGDDHVAGAWF